jgi:hypothetical protein
LLAELKPTGSASYCEYASDTHGLDFSNIAAAKASIAASVSNADLVRVA